MTKHILSLGFRIDVRNIEDDIKKVVKEREMDAQVHAFGSREALKKWLDTNATVLKDNKSFDPNRGVTIDTEAWQPYRLDNISLFVCSTVTKEGSSEYASTVCDGERFAKRILPGTPLVVLHYGSEHIARIPLPSQRVLEADMIDSVYHLVRDARYMETIEKSSSELRKLVRRLFETDMDLPLEEYQRFLEI